MADRAALSLVDFVDVAHSSVFHRGGSYHALSLPRVARRDDEKKNARDLVVQTRLF